MKTLKPAFSAERYRLRADVLKAMANPARLFILDALAAGEQGVGELAGMLGLDISTVSRHLSVLTNAGLVSRRQKGVRALYRLRVPCALGFMECVESVLREKAEESSRAAAESDES